MIWKCLLVDDEPPALRVLEKYIDMVKDLEIVAACGNAFEAMNILNKERIDVIFLDIQMPKLAGIQLLKTLQHPPKVIFTTAFKEYAADAFDLDAVDYLVKPISIERFLKAVNKLSNSGISNEGTKALPASPGFLYFRSERKMVKVFLDEIVYVESFKDYIKINRIQDKPIMAKYSITTIEAMLPAHLFVRVHRSFIVATEKVTAFTHSSVELGKLVLPVGRQYTGRLQSKPDSRL